MIKRSFWKNKKVLITGFSGFKGFWLSLLLTELGSDVYGISKQNISSEIYNEFSKKNKYTKNFELDIYSRDKLHQVLDKIQPNVVFHLAAQSLVIKSKLDPYETINSNIIGSFNLLHWISTNSSKITTVVATTDKVYKFPQKNNVETDPLGSFELYGATKVSLENIIDTFNNDKNTLNKFSVIRSGNVLGGGDGGENRILTDVLLAIKSKSEIYLRNPNSIRPWQHVLDSIGGYVLTAQYTELNNNFEKFNLNSDQNNEFNVFELTKKLVDRFGFDNTIKIDKNSNYVESKELRIDSSKAMKLLAWKPQNNIDDIVEKIYDWEKAKDEGNVESISINQIKEYLENT